MNSTHLSPTATKIVNSLAREAAERFDAVLLHNLLADSVPEDDQLMALANAVAEAQHARDVRTREYDGSDAATIAGLCEDAEDILHRTLGERLVECIAEECRVVLTDGDDWLQEGHVDADELDAAKREAANWLLEHEDVTRRLWGPDAPAANHEATAGP